MRKLLSLVVLLCLLVSCSVPGGSADEDADLLTAVPEPSAGPPSSESVTISFAAWEYEQQLYQPLAQQFMAENPNIKVVTVLMDDLMNSPSSGAADSPQAMLRRVVTGADTASAGFISPEVFGSNLLLDLTPLMEADANFKRDDFYPGALERSTVKGGTWVLPRNIYIQLLTYNKNLFQQAGLPEPSVSWTTSDMIGVAEQIVQKSGGGSTYGMIDMGGGALALLAILKEQGVNPFATPAQDIQLDRPEVVAAVERVRDMLKSGALLRPQYSERTEPVDIGQLIRDGRVAIWSDDFIGPQAEDGPQSSGYDFEVGRVPYPSDLIGEIGYFGGGDGFVISAGTQHPAESWKWIEFLSRQQLSRPGEPSYGPNVVPARKSLAEQSGFWKQIDESTAQVYQAAIANIGKLPERTPDYTVFGALSQALSQVLDQGQTAQQALREAQRQLEEQLAQALLTPTAVPDTSPFVVATPESQEPPPGATVITFSPIGVGASEMRKLARSFREQHPDIFVEIKSTDVFTGPPELESLARTTDCFAWWSVPQSDADFKALLDIQPLLDSDANFPRDDYSPALLEPYRRGGGLFGLPYTVNLRTLNYNRTMFDAAGIQPPTYQWKPNDFLAAAQALTSGEGEQKRYGYAPLYGAQQDLFFFIGQFGARMTSGSGSDVRPNFDDPKVIEAVQWYIDLAQKHKVMPKPKFPYKRDDSGDDKNSELIQKGRAGMWFDQGYGMFGDQISSAPDGMVQPGEGGGQPRDFEVAIAPLPIGGGGLRSSDFYLRGFHISAQAKQPQGCWEWLKFLSSDIGNLQGSVPARASVAKSEEFLKQAAPETAEIAKIYTEALRQPSQPGDDMNAMYGQIDFYWFFKAISEAIEGQASLSEGLAMAQKLTSAYAECISKTPDKPATCAKQADPTYEGYNTDDLVPGAPKPLG